MKFTRRSIPRPAIPIAALILAVCVVGLLGVEMNAIATSRAASSSSVAVAATATPDKAIWLQQEISAQATADAKEPHAPKNPQPSVTSCPLPPVQSGIRTDATAFGQYTFVSWAVVAPTQGRPFQYNIYAGAEPANTQQGVLLVQRLTQDPCAPGAPATQLTSYDTPYQAGRLTLTALSGDSVSFTAASGRAGQFDYITAQFS